MRFKDDIVEDWLRENDPTYGTNEHYMNNDRFVYCQKRELPTDRLEKILKGGCA